MAQPPKILFSSVFKPFAEADNLYSRVDSKIELYHNQLTKYQGCFSPRVHHSSYGLYAIASNLGIPSTVLDFPTLPRFLAEVRKGYDYIGISSIMPNFQKLKRMTEEIRRLSPRTKIVVGGFCSGVENLEKMIEADYVCHGEGISFMRELLGLSPEFKFNPPDALTWIAEVMGVPFFWNNDKPGVVVGLGCPQGCDFCAPSHLFGRRHIKFLKTGREIFEAVTNNYRRYKSNVMIFIGDDNFLADRKRARELHGLVKESGTQWRFLIFASADHLSEWDPAELAEMGVFNIWIGREGKFSDYPKNRDIDMKELIASLHRYGISVVLSSILLLERHTKQNIWEDVEDHLACNPDLSQFSHLAPLPGTALYERLKEEDRILDILPFEEWHAFKRPWFIHPEFSLAEAEQIQERAYLEDFHRLGPSACRWMEAEIQGFSTMRDSKSAQLRGRAEMIKRDFWKFRIMLEAAAMIFPDYPGRQRILQAKAKLEEITGRINTAEKALAAVLYVTGKTREYRTRRWGDAIQPKTIYRHYSGA